MPAALSTLGVPFEVPAIPRFWRAGSAVSAEARAVWQAIGAVMESTERSQSWFGRKAAAISQMWALANECDEPGWDGDSALPVDPAAAFAAADFIRALPGRVPLPEFAPEPDGSIALDWIRSRNRLFSLSVGTSDRLAFAWLDGSDRGHGVARFDGATIPARILEGIDEIMKHGNAAIWPR